jgi:hypothetical protein
MRMPGFHDERLALVGVQQDDLELAAIARVHEPGRVHDREPVPRRETERGWTKPA